MIETIFVIVLGSIFLIGLSYLYFRDYFVKFAEESQSELGSYTAFIEKGQIKTPSTGGEAYDNNVSWFEEALKKVKSNTSAYIVAGELNPLGYEKLSISLKEAIDRGLEMNLIFGPHLAIRNENIKYRIDFKLPIQDSHPILKLASENPKKLKLYLPKNRKRQSIHSGVIGESSIIEEYHKEMEERSSVWIDDIEIAGKIKNNIKKLIEKGQMEKIDAEKFPRNYLRTIDELINPDIYYLNLSKQIANSNTNN